MLNCNVGAAILLSNKRALSTIMCMLDFYYRPRDGIEHGL